MIRALLNRRFTSLLLASALAVAGCTSPNFQTEYYTLLPDSALQSDIESAVDQQQNALSGISIGVGPVRLPDMLKHSGIVSHGDDQRVYVAHYQVWAGDLEDAVTRVLASNLSAHLGHNQVWPFPWNSRVRPERQLAVVIERFSGERGGEVVFQAKWRLLGERGRKELHSARSNLQIQTEDDSYGAYVRALNQLLNEFSRTVGDQMESLAAGPEPRP